MAYVGGKSKNKTRPDGFDNGRHQWRRHGRNPDCKGFNCRVIATAGNKEKMDKCLEIGADHVVNHREQDWYKKVREITKKQGVDVVFEHIGKTTFPYEVGLLKTGGTLVATGATTGYDSTIDLRYLFFKGTNLLRIDPRNKRLN